ncbi:MAG: cellulase family glycosylhydrolase [Porcipelethomonas sp.]
MSILKKIISAVTAAALCIPVAAGAFAGNVSASGTVRNMTSQQIVSDMGLGWNLGNTFDAFYANQTASPEKVETLWGNPKVTKELIQSIKGHGFKTIRIPVTWMNCIDSSNNIDTAFLDRVQEVVDYCIGEGLYVILNMHHDGGDTSSGCWLRDAKNDYSGVSAKYEKLWQQIAGRFADYSDYLIFESMNEVGFEGSGSVTDDDYTTLNNLNQLFVNTIRNSGSNNANRHLLIAGYFTDVEKTCNSRFSMPSDPAGRCIVSIHYYTPSTFCVAEKGSSWGYRSTWGTESDYKTLNIYLDKLVKRFTQSGTPVIIGEYGVLTESKNGKDSASIAKFLRAVAEGSLERGMCPVIWDSGNGGDMKYINRKTYEWNLPVLDNIYTVLSGEYRFGDVTQDRQVDVFDAICIAQYTVGKKTLDDYQSALADYNNDGNTDVFDAIAIAKFTVS